MSSDKPSDEVKVSKSTIPQISAAAQELVQLFRSTPVGQGVTYAMMSAAVGFDVLTKRGVIVTAVKRVLADDGVHMAAVRCVGYKRLSPEEAAATLMPAKLSRARSAARSCSKTAAKISVLDLPSEQRATFAARATLAELITQSTSTKSVNMLAAAASTQGENTAILAQRMALEALKAGE